MDSIIERRIHYLFYSFIGLFPFLIYPWGKNIYYANGKAYYFLGVMLLLGALAWFREKRSRGVSVKGITSIEWILLIFLFLVGCSTLHSVEPSLVGNLTEHQGLLMMAAYDHHDEATLHLVKGVSPSV